MNEQQAQQFATAFSRVYARVTNVGKCEISTFPIGIDTLQPTTIRLEPGKSIMYGVSVPGICKLYNGFGYDLRIKVEKGHDSTLICILEWDDAYKG